LYRKKRKKGVNQNRKGMPNYWGKCMTLLWKTSNTVHYTLYYIAEMPWLVEAS